MKKFKSVTHKFRLTMGLVLCLLLSSCVGTIVGAVVDTTIEVVKVPFKLVGAVVDLAIPDKDEDD